MKSYERDVKDVGKVEYVEFDSLQDFKNYIKNTPINNAFKGERLSSNRSDSYFSKTSSFDEAMNLFTDGWTSMSTEINNKLSVGHGAMINERAMQRVLSVQGFQPVVPLYLSGVPQNMVSTRFKPMKKKVITIDKDVWTAETENIAKFYEQFGDKLPQEIKNEFEGLQNRLK